MKRTVDLPSALDRLPEICARGERGVALFLDYDGVLTPIVPRPGDANLSEQMRRTVASLAGVCTVAIVSGRDLADVRQMVAVPGIAYAGSHGFDIESPDGRFEHAEGVEHLSALALAEEMLRESLAGLPGARLERKRFAVAVHFRDVAPPRVPAVREAVEEAQRQTQGLRITGGKKVFELRPDVDWDKGKAVSYLLEKLGRSPLPLPVYLGDDLTDEDAFRELRQKGVGIYVGEELRPTDAAYRLNDVGEVRRFLEALAAALAQ